MQQESSLAFQSTAQSDEYFNAEHKSGKYIVYDDIHLHATLDYDPVAAIARLEADVEAKDAIIARLSDRVSDQDSKIIDLIKDAQEAHQTAYEAKKSYNLLQIINLELKAKARKLFNQARNYGKRID